MAGMTEDALQELCERGQQLLMETRYREAEATLARAEKLAMDGGRWETLSRLYLPLQDARRQRRQQCGEGIVCLDLIAQGPADQIEPWHVLEHYPHGQLLVAGWGTIEPAVKVRAMSAVDRLYVETFLAAAYPAGDRCAVVIVPLEDMKLPPPRPRSMDELMAELPPRCIVLDEHELPRGPHKGTPQTYAHVMSLWERLHGPFLAAADAEPDPLHKIEAYRRTIRVDYACELAHQRLCDAARQLSRAADSARGATP